VHSAQIAQRCIKGLKKASIAPSTNLGLLKLALDRPSEGIYYTLTICVRNDLGLLSEETAPTFITLPDL
jgi:hypothetical protein